MSDEKRNFSRVPTRLKGYARVMRSIDSSPIFSADVVQRGSASNDPFRNSKMPDELANFLMEMDRKLDQVIGLLSQDTLRTDFPIDIEIREISAAGVKFRSDEPLNEENPMEIVILLSHVPLRMAGSKGQILGIEKETGLYRFEFVDTRESDMEAMVQFVFKEQREQIRNSKM